MALLVYCIIIIHVRIMDLKANQYTFSNDRLRFQVQMKITFLQIKYLLEKEEIKTFT